ncbi:MAG: flippase-like domain-containing protein, partial [Bacteroidia bacterium]
LAFFSRARRWILMIRPLGYNPAIWSTYHAMMTGYLVNFALPRMGEVTKCVVLGRKEKIPVDRLIGTVIVERTIDVLSMLFILLLMLFLRHDLMGSFIGENVIGPINNKITNTFGSSYILFAILGAIMAVIATILWFSRHALRKNRFFSKVSDFAGGIVDGLRSFYSMEHKSEFILHTIFIWTNYIMMSWVIVFAIPATSSLTFADATFLVVIGSLGMSAPVQGGIGAFHWIVSRGLYFVYGISIEDGLVYATLAHESQMILIAILGAFSFYRLYGKTRKKAGETINNETRDG